MAGNLFNPLCSMLVMLAYDTPEQRHQNFLRKEFERMGGARVQYMLRTFLASYFWSKWHRRVF